MRGCGSWRYNRKPKLCGMLVRTRKRDSGDSVPLGVSRLVDHKLLDVRNLIDKHSSCSKLPLLKISIHVGGFDTPREIVALVQARWFVLTPPTSMLVTPHGPEVIAAR
jgi:hypothetical protein